MAKFIYLIHATGTEFYKVGISRKPKVRLANLQIGCPMQLAVTTTVQVDHPQEWEGYIHRRLHDCAVHGEWFQLNEERLERVLNGFRTLAERTSNPPNIAQTMKEQKAQDRRERTRAARRAKRRKYRQGKALKRQAKKAEEPKCIKFPYNGQQGEVVLQKYKRTGKIG